MRHKGVRHQKMRAVPPAHNQRDTSNQIVPTGAKYCLITLIVFKDFVLLIEKEREKTLIAMSQREGGVKG